mmetsp:Transcript_26068/g.39900  ORF Transcript_26068/g.39900 Transcript_26068/m.39900 type:complete len:87 (-) Transcript_26068:9-269(-)
MRLEKKTDSTFEECLNLALFLTASDPILFQLLSNLKAQMIDSEVVNYSIRCWLKRGKNANDIVTTPRDNRMRDTGIEVLDKTEWMS